MHQQKLDHQKYHYYFTFSRGIKSNIYPIDSRAVLPFKGGETEAIARLNHYFFETNCISEYKETRNGLIGETITKFSPWLAMDAF